LDVFVKSVASDTGNIICRVDIVASRQHLAIAYTLSVSLQLVASVNSVISVMLVKYHVVDVDFCGAVSATSREIG